MAYSPSIGGARARQSTVVLQPTEIRARQACVLRQMLRAEVGTKRRAMIRTPGRRFRRIADIRQEPLPPAPGAPCQHHAVRWSTAKHRKILKDYRLNIGAGEGNRTLVISLEGFCSTIELHPRRANSASKRQNTAYRPRSKLAARPPLAPHSPSQNGDFLRPALQ